MAFRVGAEVDAFCTKCKMDLTHRIVAVFEAKPKRVECLTCHTQHNYRKPKGAPDPAPKAATSKTAKTSKRTTKARGNLQSEWQRLTSGKPPEEFVDYSAKKSFGQDQLVAHKVFGPGFVSEVREDNKITVVFREGPKVLVHARG